MATRSIMVLLCFAGACAHASDPIPANPARAAPASLDALLAKVPFGGPGHIDEWRRAVRPYLGAQIEWELFSWGGENTSESGGYSMPDRHLGKITSRVRLVSPSLKGGDLEDIGGLHSAVVTCATVANEEEGTMVFPWGKAASKPADLPTNANVRLRGRFWGVRGESGWLMIWLDHCEVAP